MRRGRRRLRPREARRGAHGLRREARRRHSRALGRARAGDRRAPGVGRGRGGRPRGGGWSPPPPARGGAGEDGGGAGGGVAEGVEPGEARREADEEIELVAVPVGELRALVRELEDAKTIAGLLLYLDERERRGERSRFGFRGPQP